MAITTTPSAPNGSLHEPDLLPTTSVINPSGEGKVATEKEVDQLIQKTKAPLLGIDFTRTGRPRRASTHLLTVSSQNVCDVINDSSATNLVNGGCCGGGCSRLPASAEDPVSLGADSRGVSEFVKVPDNAAFKSLNLKLSPLTSRHKLTGITNLPEQTITIEPVDEEGKHESTVNVHPPKYVTPHPPWSVYSAKIDSARELTKPGAPKRTYHFDLDVTNYPEEITGVDFRVGGAIGVVAPNDFKLVTEILDILGADEDERDAPIQLHTRGGRWPTIWGKAKERTLTTTLRELLTWTVDIQSYPPTKDLIRLLAEYATDDAEKAILLYLCSRQGQAAFCELRTGPYISLVQLLNAFPSSKPPLDHLLCNLPTLMPRFYSLSCDPRESKSKDRRIIEIAVTVHEHEEGWRSGSRTGVGSGFFERCARRIIDEGAEDVRIPMFRGLMANPLAKQFQADGPMLLIGAGVGIAPFRGFVQRRLQSANCANKVWVIQGIRDSLLDELYSGEWGEHEDKIRSVVQSRVGTGRYVQEEVFAQADLVWSIVNSLDGRVFVCGSSKGMGEGVHESLVKVVMKKSMLGREQAEEFWQQKKDDGQYIAVCLPSPSL
ncbi:hypothetical protein L873DRAFT_1674042 [Choiromyces venosus 120613-1]|uniref:FAD-binding FR-type domain-containing protein n=1 Tax=Choiromyces venosus 120613-1 TaxID=1336337 RepID=A0A3N4K171_9PEZI|nr:hypothetical protein L873DRAFT_1674042 [Choiromyces venosus 120613-1]